MDTITNLSTVLCDETKYGSDSVCAENCNKSECASQNLSDHTMDASQRIVEHKYMRRKCGHSSAFRCFAFCNVMQQSSNKCEQLYDHYCLYSVLSGRGIKCFNSDGTPVNGSVNKVVIKDNILMAIDCEFINDIYGNSYAARIALVSQYTGVSGGRKNASDVYELVFHALVRLPEVIWNPDSKFVTHVNVNEHTTIGICRRTCPKEIVVKELLPYLNNFRIVWKNINSDLAALIGIGVTLEADKVSFIDIENFYSRYIPSSGSQQPISLKWINRHILRNKSQNDMNPIHSAISDARNTLKAYRKAEYVIPFHLRDKTPVVMAISKQTQTICKISAQQLGVRIQEINMRWQQRKGNNYSPNIRALKAYKEYICSAKKNQPFYRFYFEWRHKPEVIAKYPIKTRIPSNTEPVVHLNTDYSKIDEPGNYLFETYFAKDGRRRISEEEFEEFANIDWNHN